MKNAVSMQFEGPLKTAILEVREQTDLTRYRKLLVNIRFMNAKRHIAKSGAAR